MAKSNDIMLWDRNKLIDFLPKAEKISNRYKFYFHIRHGNPADGVNTGNAQVKASPALLNKVVYG